MPPPRRLLVVVLLLLLLAARASLAAAEQEAAAPTVWTRGLVTRRTSARAVLRHHDRLAAPRKGLETGTGTGTEGAASNETLAFVTPWNGRGYDLAKQLRAKFAYVCPVWFLIRRRAAAEPFELVGDHDVDRGWMADVRGNDSEAPPLICPRFHFDGWSLPQVVQLLGERLARSALVRAIVRKAKEHAFDGVVIDLASQGAGRYAGVLRLFVGELGDALHKQGRQLILTLMPRHGGGEEVFGESDLRELQSKVDRFVLMTYDYASPGRPGPNAPLPWVESAIATLLGRASPPNPLAARLLVGLNLYGYTYAESGGGEAVLGPQFLDILRVHKPRARWLEEAAEHVFKYQDGFARHNLYYPTLASLARRLDLFHRWGVGASLWEIGQGLDYFYDLF